MKRIGLIGGLGPESTVDYYKRIINSSVRKDASLVFPEIIIFSVNMAELVEMMKERRYEDLKIWMLDKLQKLKNAGAEIAAITANTPHVIFDELEKTSPLPLVSIVRSTLEYSVEKRFKRPGLFGTGFTMKEDFYQKEFMKKNLPVILPNENEKKYINEKIFNELEHGIFNEQTKKGLYAIARNMLERDEIDSLILGCTELPLIMDKPFSIPFLDTTDIHVKKIMEIVR